MTDYLEWVIKKPLLLVMTWFFRGGIVPNTGIGWRVWIQAGSQQGAANWWPIKEPRLNE
jgi:hypothetical protein